MEHLLIGGHNDGLGALARKRPQSLWGSLG